MDYIINLIILIAIEKSLIAYIDPETPLEWIGTIILGYIIFRIFGYVFSIIFPFVMFIPLAVIGAFSYLIGAIFGAGKDKYNNK